jgi:hypothetical protein
MRKHAARQLRRTVQLVHVADRRDCFSSFPDIRCVLYEAVRTPIRDKPTTDYLSLAQQEKCRAQAIK